MHPGPVTDRFICPAVILYYTVQYSKVLSLVKRIKQQKLDDSCFINPTDELHSLKLKMKLT